MKPQLSEHFKTRLPSAIRLAQIEFMKRTDKVLAVNTAIGNVSLPMHPAMAKRMFSLKKGPFADGVVKYSPTVGEVEANQTFLHLIAASGFSTKELYCQITDGGSQAMELAILGVCGPSGSKEKPLLLIDPAYPNYASFAERTGRRVVSVTRHLEGNGKFTLPKLSDIEKIIEKERPGALLVIPYDNPTGQFFSQKILNELGNLCLKHNLWMISDETYREMFYSDQDASSIWAVPGIEGRRISVESASKVWNACGLRIGAIITDSAEFHQKSVAEYTANLCANVIGQYIFGALLHETKKELQIWYKRQREYYKTIASDLVKGLNKQLPDLIVSSPDASLYSVVDVRNMFPDFDSDDFVLYCARQGKVKTKEGDKTLLVAPMAGFYTPGPGQLNPGKTQMRIAYVEPPAAMAEVPELLTHLLHSYSTHASK